MSSNPHWVASLFPPTYGYTTQELLKEPIPPKHHQTTCNAETENTEQTDGPTAFDHLAQRIPPEDVASIRNVYHRVWMMMQHEAELKGTAMTKELEAQTSKDADTSTTDLPKQWEEDIWSTSEINILRRVFRQAQQENVKLAARLKATETEYDTIKQKHQKHKLELDTATHSLNAIRKVNKRLQIMCENLKGNMDQCNKRMGALEEEIVHLKQETMAKSREVQKHKSESDKQRLARKKMQLELKNKNKEFLLELQLREDNLRSMHAQDVQIFQKRIIQLENELVEEKIDHARDKKGLNVLRAHFASLPYAGETEKQSMITKDELKTWN